MFGKRRLKIFCIGRNKTGTTSLGAALGAAGFHVACQNPAENLAEDWARRDFRRIVQFCKTADAFQDVPFSMAYTYQVLDYAFPRSRFILTVRDSSEQWFESLMRYHAKVVGKDRVPTVEDLKDHPYVYKGWMWRQQEIVFGADEYSLYNREKYIAHYEKHNADVLEYFRFRPDDLLVLNLADADAGRKLERFLALPTEAIYIPHLNTSAD